MKVFIVLAHPEAKSFNGALKDLAVEVFSGQGHEVRVSDLYGMKFEAVGGPWEFESLPDADRFEYMSAQKFAHDNGTTASDVKAEHEKLVWCDLLVLQFPMWWFGMPGMLKGWTDRVMTYGFAYGDESSYENGGFKGRRATCSLTTGVQRGYYELRGRGGYMDHLLWPIHNGTLRYCGFDVLPPFIAWGADIVDGAMRKQYLEDYRSHLIGLETAEPMFFHTAEDYGEEENLKPGITARTPMQNPDLLKDS